MSAVFNWLLCCARLHVIDGIKLCASRWLDWHTARFIGQAVNRNCGHVPKVCQLHFFFVPYFWIC
jgi:hypothetical protein